MGRLSELLKLYDINDVNDKSVSDEENTHDISTIKLTIKPPTPDPVELYRNNVVSQNDVISEEKACVGEARADLCRNVVYVVSPLALEPDPLTDAGWSGHWRERIQTHLQTLEDWVWRDEYDLMRVANNGLPKARGQAREKLTRWYLFMLEGKKAVMV